MRAHWRLWGWIKNRNIYCNDFFNLSEPPACLQTSPVAARGGATSPARLISVPTPPPHGVTSKGWSATCLRPSPPLRPCLALGLSPYSRPSHKLISYKEDGLILDIIEAYCCTVKPRHTVHSGECLHYLWSFQIRKSIRDCVTAIYLDVSKVKISRLPLLCFFFIWQLLWWWWLLG